MKHRDERLQRIDAGARARMIDAYSPGARVVRARRLRGGLGARTRVLDIEDLADRRWKVVLRVYLPGRQSLTPERARREFRILELVHGAGVPSPRALLLDAEGRFFDEPAMVLSYLPGRSLYQPPVVDVWVTELARAMLSVHAITPAEHELAFLPRLGREELGSELEGMREPIAAHEDEIAREAFAILEANLGRIVWVEPCLIHEDFWPGNTVWFRNRLVGVIDWSEACLGDPRLDPAQCGIDSHLVSGAEVSGALRAAYERLAPRPVPDQWYFDLYLGREACSTTRSG